jgi:hypothetical protein
MTWTFIWLMLLLKIPIGGLLWIVWWAIHQTDEEPMVRGEDGGSKVQSHRNLHPRRPPPRRGPHAGAPPPAPPRTRSVVARTRKVEHQ